MRRLAMIIGLMVALGAGVLPTVAQSPQFYVVEYAFNWNATSSYNTTGRFWSYSVPVQFDDPIHAVITTGTGTAQANAEWGSLHGNGNLPQGVTTTIAHCYRYLTVTTSACDASGVSWSTTSASTMVMPPTSTTLRYEIIPPGYPTSATATVNITTVYLVLWGIPRINASFTANPTGGVPPLDVTFTDTSTANRPIVEWLWTFGDGATSSEQHPTHTYSYPGVYTVTLFVSDGELVDDVSTNITVAYPQADLIHPLAPADRDTEWGVNGLFDWDYVYQTDPEYFWELLTVANLSGIPPLYTRQDPPFELSGPLLSTKYHAANGEWYSVFAISNDYNDNVLAVADGRVLAVTKATSAICRNQFTPFMSTLINDGNCYFKMPHAVIAGDKDYIFKLDLTNVYVVTVGFESGNVLEYVVTSPTVEALTDISAGCILGKTLDMLKTLSMSELNNVNIGLDLGVGVALASGTSTKGVALINLRNPSTGDAERLRPRLGIDAEGSTTCSDDLSECLGENPRFYNDGEVWSATRGVIWLNPGVILPPNGIISTVFALDENNTDYHLYIGARTSVGGGDASFTAQIGDYLIRSPFLTTQAQEFAFALDQPIQDGYQGLYAVAVHNISTLPIQIDYYCITDGPKSQQPGRGACYFKDSSFDLASTYWTLTDAHYESGVNDLLATPLAAGGSVFIGDGGTISQAVTLHPNDDASPHTYTLTVEYAPWFSPSAPTPQSTLVIEVEWPDGAGFEEISSVDVADWPKGLLGIDYSASQTATFPIEVSTLTSGNMTFRVRVEDGTDIQGGRLLSVCLSPEGDSWPGEDIIFPPFSASCGAISMPSSSDFRPWVEYHWQQLNRFFQCDLMILLNKIWLQIVEFQSLVAKVSRYFIASNLYISRWVSTELFPWLNGHFYNMATSGRTFVEQGGGTGLWDVLLAFINAVLGPLVQAVLTIVNTLANLVNLAAQLLFTAINGLLGLFFAIAGALIGLILTVVRALAALITGWNTAAPTPIPYLPNCADPTSSVVCVGVWFMENTFFATTVGKLVVPLVIGLGSWTLIEWIVDEVRGALSQAGTSS